jgi:hypothetical protein
VDINANAGFGRHKLRATGDALLVVDGPAAGFALNVMHAGGDPVGYARVGTGRAAGTLKRGQAITVKDRTEIWTMGTSSTLDVTHADGKAAA